MVEPVKPRLPVPSSHRLILIIGLTLWLREPLNVEAQTYEEKAVAAVLMGEAWSEGISGMTAVAEVIHQRAKDKRWAPLQVVSAHRGRVHAFSCLNQTTVDKLIAKFERQPDFEKALQIAKITCQSPTQLPGFTKTADHFSRVEEKPYWAKGHQPVAIIGRHAFYKLKRY